MTSKCPYSHVDIKEQCMLIKCVFSTVTMLMYFVYRFHDVPIFALSRKILTFVIDNFIEEFTIIFDDIFLLVTFTFTWRMWHMQHRQWYPPQGTLNVPWSILTFYEFISSTLWWNLWMISLSWEVLAKNKYHEPPSRCPK